MQTLKRVPKAAFIAGYGALLIALVVMVAALASYRQSADANAPAAPGSTP